MACSGTGRTGGEQVVACAVVDRFRDRPQANQCPTAIARHGTVADSMRPMMPRQACYLVLLPMDALTTARTNTTAPTTTATRPCLLR